MLTWEDGFYDNPKSTADASNCRGGNGWSETGGNPLDQGGSGDLEGQIGLAVARMSYYVYSMGEGIIGRVAFTGKHQWVSHDGENHLEGAPGGKPNNQSMSEKNPDGWQNQFAAGIKTIAVIAVPQGVVQLGSTKLMQEDLKWIDHIRSAFGALQTASSAPRPDILSEGQGGRITYNSVPPFLAGSNISTTARRPVIMQQGQPLPRLAEDAVYWQKFGSPIGMSNTQGLQSMGGAISVAATVKQELQYQLPRKVVVEPQITKYASAESRPLSVHVTANVPRFDVPSKSNNKILSCDDMRSRPLGDIRTEQFNDSTWMDLTTGSISHSLCNELKRDHVVPTCVRGQLDENLSQPQEDHPLKKRFVLCSIPDTKKEEAFSNVPPSFRAGNWQQLDIQTELMLNQHLPNLNNTSSMSSALECADLPSVTDKMVNQDCLNVGCSAAANVASHLASESFIPKFHASEGFASASTGDAHWNSWNKSESQCSERESDFCSLGSQSDVNTLDELEKFLASFSKEENGNWDCSFAIGDELSQALGPAFWKGGMEELTTLGASQKNMQLGVSQVGKAHMCQDELATKWGSKLVCDNSYKKLQSACLSEGKREPLLDAIISNTSNSHHSVSSNTDGTFSEKAPFSHVTSGIPVLSISQETEAACNSSLSGKILQAAPNHETMYHGNSAGGVKNLQCHQNLCVSSDTHTNVTPHSWTDEGQSLRSDDTRHSLSKRSDDLSKSSKKRSRSGESTRPRPKDRQQIQDRVRELRDIVPNGSKCSIDALLEKTIKHMLFLHSVSLHADQLKNNGGLKDDSDSGASWAVDLGSQDKRYPIVVKDLSQPRQMLVEMMCEESDLFLEIADIIRSLGLTILRGVMESHSDKFWAKFVVEANRDIERVDVLVSLIQRLHLDNNSSSSSMTITSQSAPLRPQQGVDSSSSYTVCGNK